MAAGSPSLPDSSDLDHMAISLGSHHCTLIQHTALARPAYELRIPAAHVGDVWRVIWQAGKPLGLIPLGTMAFESLRIEAGWPVFGRDIDESNLPQEVGRTERAISFTKGCYLGQETVARIDALGHVNRHLVGLLIPSERDSLPPGAKISKGDKVLGQITSSAHSLALGHSIALGYVRRGSERPGTELVIDLQGRMIPAFVSELPLIRS